MSLKQVWDIPPKRGDKRQKLYLEPNCRTVDVGSEKKPVDLLTLPGQDLRQIHPESPSPGPRDPHPEPAPAPALPLRRSQDSGLSAGDSAAARSVVSSADGHLW